MARRKVRIERPADVNFDERKADRAVNFFRDYLVHVKGRWNGKPFVLSPWQAHDIREVFGRVDEQGNRIIRQVYIEIPKKNGKSEVAAGVALKLLFADDEAGAEIYGAASEREQASIVFDIAVSMVRRNPKLKHIARVIDSTQRIVIPNWGSYYQALSAEVQGKHGYNAHGIIFDEAHAQRTMELWEVLTFGSGAARTQPLIWTMTTAGIPGESPVAEMLHEEADAILRGHAPCPPDFYPVIYAAEDDDPWDSEETWRACNPAYGDFLSESSVKGEFTKAQRRTSELNSFLRLRLNRWVKQERRAIDMEQWRECAGPVDLRELRGKPCYAGLDLSTKLDVTAFVLVWFDGNRIFHVKPWFWIPQENLRDRSNIELHKYRSWIDSGYITATVGNAVDFAEVRKRINEIGREVKIREIAFDPMFATQLSQELAADGFTMVEFRQNFRDFTEPFQELESCLADRRLRHGGNPVLDWMADCVTAQQKPDGSIRPVKPERLKSSRRVDGIVAMLMGMSRAIRNGPQKISVYATRGLHFLS